MISIQLSCFIISWYIAVMIQIQKVEMNGFIVS